MVYGLPSCTGREEPHLAVLVGAVEGISSTVRRREGVHLSPNDERSPLLGGDS